jgi:hypothetical protein
MGEREREKEREREREKKSVSDRQTCSGQKDAATKSDLDDG